MIHIILRNASNGVIKEIQDDNFNGSGNEYSETKLYEIDSYGQYAAMQTFSFLNDLAEDLGLNMGEPTSKENLRLKLDWGDAYLPAVSEIHERIKSLKNEIKGLKGLEQKIISLANG